jgi:hypothetical protein
MEKAGLEPLPIPELPDMCPQVAVQTLNRHGYNIGMPKPNTMFGMFEKIVQQALIPMELRLVNYGGSDRLAGAKIKIIRKDSDGVLLLQDKLNPNILHFIAFISDNKKTFFYDPVEGRLEVFKIKDLVRSVTEFDEDIINLFPEYNLVQISFIEPNYGGRRRKTRKSRRKMRKTKRRV